MGYRYIGSKARIADAIIDYIGNGKESEGRFIDLFSGTGIVASTAASNGWRIVINDMMRNALVMSEASLLCTKEVPFEKLGGYANAQKMLNGLCGERGFFWREYSPASLNVVGVERKYFTEKNAMKIDAIVKQIHEWKRTDLISEKEFSLLMSIYLLKYSSF